ncbi:acyl homoserine lactone synthase [Roseovarius azorensis]|uniref:Acyl-homoserine-lactone synthase n=1 Tax=Roseovarius azorensis TaxID=1287727 RepID=A0A1H7LPP1_9RHOB|nr:acyl-homoserine-lactone synthase [Roseovarius azorensis]SEL00962.1 acyl homoserine lactone synthase [Roseovarius azorensis]
MIIVIDALNRHKFPKLLDEMFKLRARVFGDRLGWDVNIVNGRERDHFDDLDPAYVIGLDDDGDVVSCVRALQTTGPHMLADVFSAILDGEPPIRSATIWESTRFCVDTKRLARGTGRNTVSYATCELMLGSLEYAQASGITDIITVIDPLMDRVLKRSDNAPYDYVGKIADMGKVPALAALLDCTDERITRLRNFAGIHHDVFVAEDEIAAAENFDSAAENNATPRVCADLAQYCDDQISTAATEKEKYAALRLRAALADRIRSGSGMRA